MAALLALFMLALRLPLRGRGSRLSAWISTALVTIGAVAVVIAANVALYRHDVHFDVSREGRNTPPAQFTAVVDHLQAPLSLTYFYNSGDDNALIARDLIEIAARGHPLFAFRAIDLDKEPGLARDVGVHAYNTAVFQAGDRKVMVENTTDVTAPVLCGAARARGSVSRPSASSPATARPSARRQPHFHYSHVETLRGHDVPGAGDVLVADPEGLDRLQIALTEIGYEMRGIVPAAASAIPADCAVVADIGPRTRIRAGRSGSAGQTTWRAAAGCCCCSTRYFRSARISKAVCSAPSRWNRSRPSSSTRSIISAPTPTRSQCRIIRRTRSPSASRSLSFRRRGRYASGPPPAGGDDQDSRRQQPGQLSAAHCRRVLQSAWAPDRRRRNAEDRGAQRACGRSRRASGLEEHPASTSAWWSPAPASSPPTNISRYVSNGELAVAILRWLADDEATPTVKPQSYSLPEIELTSRQMRDVFIALEVLLPLTTILCGVLVWWRRR